MALASPLNPPGVRIEWVDANAQQLDRGRTDVAGFLGIAERGPLHLPVKLESASQFSTVFGAPIEHGCLAYAVAGYFANGGRTCWVVRVADPLQARPARLQVVLPGLSFVLRATSPGEWGNRIQVEAVWGSNGVVALMATEGEQFQRIELSSVDDKATGGQRFIGPRLVIRKTLLGVPSAGLPELRPGALVALESGALAAGSPTWYAQRDPPALFANGDDGLGSLQAYHFSGTPPGQPQQPWGVDPLDRIDGVSFIAAPDLMFCAVSETNASKPAAARVAPAKLHRFEPEAVRDAQIAILGRCIARKDRIALLDTPALGITEALAYRGTLPDTCFGALYYPWLLVDDPLHIDGDLRMVPPSGQVAGMVARSDLQYGVHRPPANALLEGVWDLARRVDDAAHAWLNEEGVNVIRSVPGRGVLVLGARTLEHDLRWRYVNVRRLFSMIEQALQEQMQWLAFEPNNPRLWKEIDRTVRGFLERLYRAGMLDGETSAQAYTVRCDASTNPVSDTDEGRVVCEIGIQPPYPAEFVIVRIGVIRNGIDSEQKGALDG